MARANTYKSSAEEPSRILERYERSIIPRAAVVGIPYVGSTIDVLLSGKASRRWQERVMSLLDELRIRLGKIEESHIDKGFLDSDEFQQLIIRVFQALQSSYEHEKITYFAEILSRVITKGSLRDERAERYITLVNELTGLHIRIIKLFAERRESSLSKGRAEEIIILGAKEISEILSVSQEQIEAFCSDLVAHCLLYDPQVGLADYRRGSYALHPSAVHFIKFLNLSVTARQGR